jgi:hypothetical protein
MKEAGKCKPLSDSQETSPKDEEMKEKHKHNSYIANETPMRNKVSK